ncbi:hypothetical protein BZARG_2725 [Bizionia argentinensis JUB59]|uniref:FAD-dependent urate hydroxylase HpyO/Asp monooxygenase CreE-like FAD/NAD(P)-binding domain-containing protein n=1 Tax=Bizionia argentinensis JUB59 TaxID=1046627 RepID=G2EAP8_9FLAO|nr:FAD/NAD(P)-binding protein [Bizionia argentinensis]EGV44480.2 hypothetical protein BZARG_2725 [Bizionia argentinensis JUB59]
MKKLGLAIIGSGATSIYCLKHILDNSAVLKKQFNRISIFERSKRMGYGMPYNPDTTDLFNLSNISSEEIPLLFQTFADWLRNQNRQDLKKWHVTEFPIEDSEVYSRIALGEYFHQQFLVLMDKLQTAGFAVEEYTNHEILDIEINDKNNIKLIAKNASFKASKVIIATGHNWQHNDKPASGYYDTPWPIKKIIPKNDAFYNFEIGVLGASLSAFDVVSSLAHRHGKFTQSKKGLEFQLNKEAKNFKITLHAAQGWLPHLQYEQEEPFREIYRHATREKILSLRNENGFLKIDSFFHSVCRSALQRAFEKDGNKEMLELLTDTKFGFKDFIEIMAKNHEYLDSFEGMKKELVQAKDSVENNKPIHWMETLDDLMYCLNFHAEMMPAEDHLFFKKDVKPFLMSVIAALPLSSAKILLALYDAEVVNLIAGRVRIIEDTNIKETTDIEISKADNKTIKKSYQLFINCSGNDNINVDTFPFQSLVKSGFVKEASAKFETVKKLTDLESTLGKDTVWKKNNEVFLNIGGIAVDSAYHIIGVNGKTCSNIHDLSFTHTHGFRPYSYGLQACLATSLIVVDSWLILEKNTNKPKTIEEVSKIYDKDDDL